MAEGAGFENRCARKGTAGSNPALSGFYAFCSVVCRTQFSSFGRIQFVALALERKSCKSQSDRWLAEIKNAKTQKDREHLKIF